VDIAQPDVARVGGITEWLKIAGLAQSHNLPVSAHLMMELSAHLHCAVPHALLLEDVEGGSLTDLGVVRAPLCAVEGCVTPPESPGHGVQFDWETLSRWEIAPGSAARTRPGRF
jgi:L-alanine-DL-glutamate epimerase-like enolase superfamily enzyme